MRRRVLLKLASVFLTLTLTVSSVAFGAGKTIDNNSRKEDTIFLPIGKTTAFAFGEKKGIVSENGAVSPYIQNNRTFVPLRFVAELLGAEVSWEKEKGGCTVKKDGREIKITFGSKDFFVNGEKITYDVPIEVQSGVTMVPVRLISEQLGSHVYWHDAGRTVIISPLDNPWVEGRKAEEVAFKEVMVTLLFF